MFDHVEARPDEQMVRISENNLRIQLAQLSWADTLHGALCSDRYKGRCFDNAMRS